MLGSFLVHLESDKQSMTGNLFEGNREIRKRLSKIAVANSWIIGVCQLGAQNDSHSLNSQTT